MSEREKLIEIIGKAKYYGHETFADRFPKTYLENIADGLLQNGVIVPPVKVGDTVYKINGVSSREYEVDYFDIFKDSSNFTFKIQLDSKNWSDYVFIEDFGKTVFFTKEAAEKALKGGAENEL